jgi:hypothetical protein
MAKTRAFERDLLTWRHVRKANDAVCVFERSENAIAKSAMPMSFYQK